VSNALYPLFRRGRPEMMCGIKRIACKGELSLNRLRNEDVPYDASIPSEKTEEPEQDVNSLEKPRRKRKGNQRENLRRKLVRISYEAKDAYEANEPTASHADPGAASPNMCSGDMNGVEVFGAGTPLRPTLASSKVDSDMPVPGPDFRVHQAATSLPKDGCPTRLTATSQSCEAESGESVSGWSTPPSMTGTSSYSTPNVQALLAKAREQLAMPMTASLSRQSIVQQEPEEEQRPELVEACLEECSLLSPPSSLTEPKLEDLMPEPFVPSGSLSSAAIPRLPADPVANAEPLLRSVSEVSALSSVSDLWHFDEVELDFDSAGVFAECESADCRLENDVAVPVGGESVFV